MRCGPAGTRRSVYRPSAPVAVLCPVAATVTETLLSGELSPARVTVPVTVPVCWAMATDGNESRTSEPQRNRSVASTPDEFRRIPKVLVAGLDGCECAKRRHAG